MATLILPVMPWNMDSAQKLLRLDKMEQHNHKTIVRLVSFVQAGFRTYTITDMKITCWK